MPECTTTHPLTLTQVRAAGRGMNDAPAIDIAGLTKSFGDNPVKGVDLKACLRGELQCWRVHRRRQRRR